MGGKPEVLTGGTGAGGTGAGVEAGKAGRAGVPLTHTETPDQKTVMASLRRS
jgi:hypothetical protein